MGNCRSKINITCGDIIKAGCVEYEGEVNPQSTLIDEDCFTIEETTQDVYTQLEQIDVTEIDDTLDYEKETDGKIRINKVVERHAEEIVDIKEQLEDIKGEAFLDTNISNLGLDFKCLQTECGQEIQTVKDLLQALIDKSCPE